jgi:DNA polymerase-4
MALVLRADEKLLALGIEPLDNLATHDERWLISHFGKIHGAWMHDSAWGRDDSPVVTESEPVSMSRETTFDRDLHAVHDKAELSRDLHATYACSVAQRPAEEGLRGQDDWHQAALRHLQECHA